VVAIAALSAQSPEVLAASGGIALGALAESLGGEAGSIYDPTRGLGDERETPEVALAHLLDLILGPLSLCATELLEASALVAGAVGVIGGITRIAQELSVLGGETPEVTLAPLPSIAALVSIDPGDQIARPAVLLVGGRGGLGGGA
jgi:hypothetical protein